MTKKCENCTMDLHIGSEIKRVLDEKGITPDWLAKKISTSRRNLYDILTRDEVSTNQLAQISKALEYDFFALYTSKAEEGEQFYGTPKKAQVSVIVELDGLQTTLNQWINKLTAINEVI